MKGVGSTMRHILRGGLLLSGGVSLDMDDVKDDNCVMDDCWKSKNCEDEE